MIVKNNDSYSLSKKNITVTISGVEEAVQTLDGNFMVRPGPNGATIRSYNPPYTGVNGAAINVRGYNTDRIHRRSLGLPAKLNPYDALIITKYADDPGTSPRPSYFNQLGRSEVDEMMAVVAVPYSLQGELFRAPAIGSGPLPNFFRSQPIPLSQMVPGKLPSVIDFNDFQGKLSPDYFTKLFSDFSGDIMDGWSTDTTTPDFQHPGYGTYLSSMVSNALLILCSNAPDSDKVPLARNLVQWGLDLASAWSDGRRNQANGGHMQGRKALILLAGHLLNSYPLTIPNVFLGKVFQEDLAYYSGDPAWWFGWKAGWIYNNTGHENYLHKHPSQWTENQAWQVRSYMEQVVGSQVGTALAMELMGMTKNMGIDHATMIQQWMQGPTFDADLELKNRGFNLPFGKSYAAGCDPEIAGLIYKKYHTTLE